MSVGNLPPDASVIIKITYVAELQVDGEFIDFVLPGSVAPWDRDANLAQFTQVWFHPLHAVMLRPMLFKGIVSRWLVSS